MKANIFPDFPVLVSSLYLSSPPSCANSQSKQSCSVSQHAWCVNKPSRYVDGERSSWLVSDLSQLGMLSLSRNKSCRCNRGWTWTTSGSTISHQSANRPLDKWLVFSDSSNNLTRISEHVFKGRDCWGVQTAVADSESCPLFPEIKVVVIALMKSSNSGEFAFLSFKQAGLERKGC